MGLNYNQLIDNRIKLIFERPGMQGSPREVEAAICALLASWETLVLEAPPFEWRRLWIEERTRLNRSIELTLADVRPYSVANQLKKIKPAVVSKSIAKVIRDMKRVKITLQEHYVGRLNNAPDSTIRALASIDRLFCEYSISPIIHGPGEVELSLLTLLTLWEEVLHQRKEALIKLKCLDFWREQLKGNLSIAGTSLLKENGWLPEWTPDEKERAFLQVRTGMTRVIDRLRNYLKQHSEYLALSVG
jgi:hypothetical protein